MCISAFILKVQRDYDPVNLYFTYGGLQRVQKSDLVYLILLRTMSFRLKYEVVLL